MVSYINSIQQVSITIGSGAASNTATITTVGANAFIIYQGLTSDDNGLAVTDDAYVTLTNSTTVTATRSATATSTIVIKCVVVDPTSSLVTGVQFGTITTAGTATSGTATITSVSTSLSAVFYLGADGGVSTGIFDSASAYSVALTNATTVTATRNTGTSGGSVISFCVVTFAAGAINSIQKFSTTAASGTSNTQTITSVVTANSMLAWGNFTNTSAAAAGDNSVPWITLTNSTTVTLTSGAAATFTCNYTVIEFVSGVLNSVQRGSIGLTAQTSNTATITSVNSTFSACSWLGSFASGTKSFLQATTAVLTNSTTVTATVGSAASPTVGYEVIEFTNVISGLFPFEQYDNNTSGNMQALDGGMKG